MTLAGVSLHFGILGVFYPIHPKILDILILIKVSGKKKVGAVSKLGIICILVNQG